MFWRLFLDLPLLEAEEREEPRLIFCRKYPIHCWLQPVLQGYRGLNHKSNVSDTLLITGITAGTTRIQGYGGLNHIYRMYSIHCYKKNSVQIFIFYLKSANLRELSELKNELTWET